MFFSSRPAGSASSSRYFLRVVCFLTLAVLVPPGVPLLAQESPPVFELPDVIAPGRRVQPASTTPASVSVVTAKELARLGVRTVGDALRVLPEVTVRDFGGLGALQEVSIRGTSSAHALVLMDGVPINSPALGIAQLNTIPVDTIERIEVLRGPFSTIYGSGALGGVINIVTRSAPGRTLHGRLGTLGTAAGSLGLGWRGPRTRISLDAITDSTSGFRTNSDYRGQTFAGRLQYAVDEHQSLSLGVSRYQAEQGVPGSTDFPSPQARQGTGRTIADLTWRSTGAGASSGLIRGYFVDETITFTDPTFAESDRTTTRGVGLEGQLVRQMGSSRVLTMGLELQRQEIDALFTSLFGTTIIQRDAWVGAAYLAHDATIGRATVLSAGLRYDIHSVYGGQLNPRLGLLHFVDDRTTLRMSVGRTFRGPTFLLLYFPGCSNPNLQPERAWSADAGIERRLSPGLVGRVTVFATDASQLIQSGCPPLNVNNATIVGGSAELEGQVTPRLQLRVNASMTNARDQAGAPVIRIPNATANAALHYALSPASVVTLVANYVGARPDLDLSTFPAATVTLPAYTLVGLRYSVTTGLGTWQVGVDNLFEVAYEPVKAFPSPGRTVFVSLTRGF